MEVLNLQSVDDVVGEIMKIHRSLPTRPSIDEVEAAETLIRNIEKEDQARLDAVARQTKGTNVPEELFMILQEMQRNMVHYQSKEQKREAMKLLELEHIHALFDDYIQRASDCVSCGSGNNKKTSYSNGSATKVSSSASVASTAAASNKTAATSASALHYSDKTPMRSKSGELFTTRDDSFVKKSRPSYYGDGTGKGIGVSQKPQIQDLTLKIATTVGLDGEKLSLIKLASLIEVSSKKGTRELNLQNKLTDQVEWLPDSIGKLSSLISLNLSENRLLVLPTTIGGLSSLKKLDLHSNQISELPDTIGDLFNLISLDLSCNQLSSLPSTLGKLLRLEELDLSSNNLSVLPDSIGSLVNLKKLTAETNDIDELPHTIGNCSSLRELHVDYNRIRALPEAVGKIRTLEILTVRYNNIRQLPTTMSSLSNLKELNVSFNELESVPESLCFATNLIKLNISNNFADLRYLPRSIGNLEMLEELDISNNQIRVLPDSFRMLSKLRVLRTDQNPLEVPPRTIAEKGAQSVVQYIDELVENRNKPLPVKQKKSWVNICFFSRSNKRKRGSADYIKSVA